MNAKGTAFWLQPFRRAGRAPIMSQTRTHLHSSDYNASSRNTTWCNRTRPRLGRKIFRTRKERYIVPGIFKGTHYLLMPIVPFGREQCRLVLKTDIGLSPAFGFWMSFLNLTSYLDCLSLRKYESILTGHRRCWVLLKINWWKIRGYFCHWGPRRCMH